jgi:hypothetical protein
MRRYVFWYVAALAIGAAAWQAFVLRWTCDDAFISFRYAQHFAEGHGLVFNLDPSEAPVEGYTNFAWTMWLALGVFLGCKDVGLEAWSIASGILCHAGVVFLLALIAWRASLGRAIVPIAACGYAAVHHAASLAPAGLETAPFVLLATVLLRCSLSMRCVRDAWLAGFVGVLTAMTRPDGALFVAGAGLFVLWDAWSRKAPRLLGAYVMPFVLVFVPYLLWRHSYYGYWLPNTFYAKSGGDPYATLGWDYVVGFALCYYALLPTVLLPWLGLVWKDPLAGASAYLSRRPWLAILAFTLPYLGFVVWVGGDFMFARFLLPIVPILLLAWDFACLRWRSPWLQPVIAVVLVAGLVLRAEPAGLDDFNRPVSDNRRISMPAIAGMPLVDLARVYGEHLQQLFAGLDVRLGIAGAHANLAYRSRAPVAIECSTGLTDAYIAHLPIKQRGRVGHEKGYWMYPGYLERRGVHFMFEQYYGKDDAWREISFTMPNAPVGLPARLVTWDSALMQELRRRDPGIVVQDFPKVLDEYIAAMPTKTKDQVKADFEKWKPFYFDHEDDRPRREAIVKFLQ